MGKISKKSNFCPFCDGEMKAGQTECFKCRNTRRAAIDQLASPKYSRDIAIKHTENKPNVLMRIFGFME